MHLCYKIWIQKWQKRDRTVSRICKDVIRGFYRIQNSFRKTLDASKESSKDCFAVYDKVLSDLEKCVSQEEITFEEKMFGSDDGNC